MRALFFSVSIGSGHDLAAQGIIEELRIQYPDCQTLLVDTFDYINHTLNRVIVGSYMETLRFSPKIWGKLYEQAEQGDQYIDLRHLLSRLLSSKLEKLVEDFAPDVVICTHAFPAGILSILKGKGKLKSPLIAVLTDYIVHSFWLHEHIDTYVIPTGDLKPLITSYGIDDKKLKDFGIPIRKDFSNLLTKEEARRKLGLINRQTFLVMGGGLGMGDMKKIIEVLGNSDLDCNILAVAGKNDKLRLSLERLNTKTKPQVYGFTTDIPCMMAASDIILTKPGGLTTAEVLATGLPMMIVAPIPGQEERNTEFLLNSGVALKVRNPQCLIPVIKQLMGNPIRVRQIKEMSAVLGRPQASLEIVKYLDSFYKVNDNSSRYRVNSSN